jgi:hypothetical protein
MGRVCLANIGLALRKICHRQTKGNFASPSVMKKVLQYFPQVAEHLKFLDPMYTTGTLLKKTFWW